MPNGPGACPPDSWLASPAVGLSAGPVLQAAAPPLLSQKVIMTMRLRMPRIPVPRWSPAEQSSHLVFFWAHEATEAYVTAIENWGHHGGTGTGTGNHRFGSPGAPRRRRDGPAQPARHRRVAAVRRALRRALRPAGRRAAGAPGAAARDRGAVAARRVRGHGEAGSGAGLVLADPGRDDRDRAGVPRHPPGAGPSGPRPRGARGPVVAAGQPGLVGRAALVAFRAAAARRPSRGRTPRAR